MAGRSWAIANRDALVPFIRASPGPIDWLTDRNNRGEAIAFYRKKHLPNVPEDVAQRHVDALLGEREGFTRGGALDSEGMMTVTRIRSELGRPWKTLTDA
jgi:hypothetical protein